MQKFIPWLFQDESEVKEYVQNQQRIEAKIDLLLKERGITWNANTLKPSEANTQPISSKRFILSRKVLSIVQSVKRHMTLRRLKLMQRFKSRKFWMAVITAILVVLNDGLDLGIDQDTVLTFAGLVISWIIGESAIDTARARGAKQNDAVDYSQADQVGE